MNGLLTMGVHDDAVAVNAPSTSDGILNFRTSRMDDIWKDFSITYSPVDRNRWYYINADSVNDPRFQTQAVLYYISSIISYPGLNSSGAYIDGTFGSGFAGNLTIEYHYLFDGATNVAD